MWTDSMVTLGWVKGKLERSKLFVKIRVTEIRQLTRSQIWRFCPGEQNQPDLVTRGATITKLKESELWWDGRTWLNLNPIAWPTMVTEGQCQIENNLTSTVLSAAIKVPQAVLQVERYIPFFRLLKVTAWVLRFNHNS